MEICRFSEGENEWSALDQNMNRQRFKQTLHFCSFRISLCTKENSLGGFWPLANKSLVCKVCIALMRILPGLRWNLQKGNLVQENIFIIALAWESIICIYYISHFYINISGQRKCKWNSVYVKNFPIVVLFCYFFEAYLTHGKNTDCVGIWLVVFTKRWIQDFPHGEC